LKNLNRVVEHNVDPSMFITMLYAQYIPSEMKLLYSFAGHEPGFFYDSQTNTFAEMKTEGLVLGVLPDSVYHEQAKTVQKGDMIVFLTDGVTECRQGERFIEREEVLDVIQKHLHLPAQKMAESVYKYFERLQSFRLGDDFTLMIIRQDV